MKTSENRSEQNAKIIGMSRPIAPVVGRRRASEPTEDVLSEPLMDVQEVVAFLHVSKPWSTSPPSRKPSRPCV